MISEEKFVRLISNNSSEREVQFKCEVTYELVYIHFNVFQNQATHIKLCNSLKKRSD